MKSILLRIFGFLVILKAIIPVGIAIVFVTFGYVFFTKSNKIITQTYQQTTNDLAIIQAQIEVVKQDIKDLKAKIDKNKASVTAFSADVKKAVQPITASLKGIQKTVLLVLGGIGGILNAIFRAINSIPFVHINFPTIDLAALEKLELIPIEFPALDVDFELDMKNIHLVTATAEQITQNFTVAIEELVMLFNFWFKILFFTTIFVVIWAAIKFFFYLFKMVHLVKKGWQLMMGHTVTNKLALL